MPEQLILEYLEHWVLSNPDEVLRLGDSKNVQFVTGDSAIDELEAQLARGDYAPDDIEERILGVEGAAYYKSWLESQGFTDLAAEGHVSSDTTNLTDDADEG